MMKILAPIRTVDGIIEKFCGGKNGCKEWFVRWSHFSEKDIKLVSGKCQYRATCDACFKLDAKKREGKRHKRPKLEIWPADRIFVDAYAMPWKPTGKPIMTGMFG